MNLKDSIYNIEVKIGEKNLVYNISTGACIEGDIKSIKNRECLNDDELDILIKEGFVVDASINESEMIKAFWTGSRYEGSDPTIMIAPTMLCNFECIYCYAPHNSLTMTKDTGHQVIEFIKNLTSSSKSCRLVWVGGEPLLALDMIKFIKLELDKTLEIELKSDVVTNGVLLDSKVAKDLADIGIKNIIVSIDGPKDFHNKRRIWKNGIDSYEVILNNIKNAIYEGLNIVIRVNVDHNNIHMLDELIKDLMIKNLMDKVSISIVPTQVFNERCSNIAEHCISTGIDMKDLIQKAENIPNSSWGGPDPQLSVCSSLCSKDFTIGPSGELYKCPVEIGDNCKVVGHINGSLVKNSFIKWMNFQPYLNEECTECQCLPLCISSCPKQLMDNNESILKCGAIRTYYKDLIIYRIKSTNY